MSRWPQSSQFKVHAESVRLGQGDSDFQKRLELPKGSTQIEAEPLTPQPHLFVQTILDVLLRNL